MKMARSSLFQVKRAERNQDTEADSREDPHVYKVSDIH
jgi:hypothetical protein